MHKSVVVFDFDGVIVDSIKTVYSIYHQADTKFSMTDFSNRFMGNQNKPNAPLARDAFFYKYSPLAPTQPLINGIADAIEQLSQKYTLTINSSGHTELIKLFLQNNNLEQYFSEVAGFDIITSKVEKLKIVFERYQITPDRCVMVTDTLGDLREATEAGVKTIAVTWGLHTIDTLKRGNPTRIAKQPSELPSHVDAIFQKTSF